jgi:hypothetical protein
MIKVWAKRGLWAIKVGKVQDPTVEFRTEGRGRSNEVSPYNTLIKTSAMVCTVTELLSRGQGPFQHWFSFTFDVGTLREEKQNGQRKFSQVYGESQGEWTRKPGTQCQKCFFERWVTSVQHHQLKQSHLSSLCNYFHLHIFTVRN